MLKECRMYKFEIKHISVQGWKVWNGNKSQWIEKF